jgi:hypothetical protein
VRGGVLVEERVVEDDPRLTDPGGVINQRELAQAPRAVVGGDLGAQDILAAGGAHLDDLALCEAQLDAFDDLAAQGERHRAADRALRAEPVWRREDLLGGQVRDVVAPCGRVLSTRHPAGALDEPDLELGAGPAVAHRAEAPFGQHLGTCGELVEALTPRAGRIGLAEAQGVGDGILRFTPVRTTSSA